MTNFFGYYTHFFKNLAILRTATTVAVFYPEVTGIFTSATLVAVLFIMFMLAQRPITLVLMMINSCSYSTNDLVFN